MKKYVEFITFINEYSYSTPQKIVSGKSFSTKFIGFNFSENGIISNI